MGDRRETFPRGALEHHQGDPAEVSAFTVKEKRQERWPEKGNENERKGHKQHRCEGEQ